MDIKQAQDLNNNEITSWCFYDGMEQKWVSKGKFYYSYSKKKEENL